MPPIHPFEAKCIQPNSPLIYINQSFSLTWIFENIGKSSWPLITLKKVNGDHDLLATPRQQSRVVPPGESEFFTVDFQAPAKPGNYIVAFRLTHGDGIEFGEKAILDVEVKDQEKPVSSIFGFDMEEYKPIEKKEEPVEKKEEVSEKEVAMMRSQQMMDKFEKEDQIEKSFEIEADAVSVESNEIQIIDDEPLIQEEDPKEKVIIAEAPADGTLIQQKVQEVFQELDLDKDEVHM